MESITVSFTEEESAAITALAVKRNPDLEGAKAATQTAAGKIYMEARIAELKAGYVADYRRDNPPSVAELKTAIPDDLSPEKVAAIQSILDKS